MERPLHLVYGNINIDIYVVVERLPGPDEAVEAREAYLGPGGAASNYSVAAARAGHRVRLVAHTGVLAREMGILEKLGRLGVDTSAVAVHDDEQPGLVVVMVSPGGERAMVKLPGANRLLRGGEVGGDADVLHVASKPLGVYEAAARACSCRIRSYDPGSSARLLDAGALARSEPRPSIVYLNRAEFRLVVGGDPEPGRAAGLARETGSAIVVKLGARGAIAATPDGDVLAVEAYRPRVVVDTTGAGDVFAAYMNAWLAEGRGLGEALQAASVAAGLKVSRRGAQSAPGREEVEEVLAREPPRLRRLA